MEKKQVQNDQKTIDLKAVIKLDSYTDEETGNTFEYVSTVLPDPFGEDTFTDVKIRPKWDDADIMFKFYAKKRLQTTDQIEFPVTLRANSYKNKKGKVITYPALFGVSPFTNKELEFRVKGDRSSEDGKLNKNIVIFNNLARAALGMDIDESDVGL